jgi:chromosome partitioning protein
MATVRSIAVTNQKGGVGKTTTVANLGAALAQRGLYVCLVDLDPQAHLTLHFGIDPTALNATTYDVLTADVPLSRAAILVENHLTVIPSVIDLAAAEVEMAGTVGREQILRDRIAAETFPYDLLMIDCPPSLGLLTLNALAAAEEVIIPLQPHFLALQGLGKLLETVSLVQRRINAGLKISGVVFCMHEGATRLAAEVVEDVTRFFSSSRGAGRPWSEARIYRTRIRRNIKLAECPSHGTTIGHYDPFSLGAADYSALAEEFMAACEGRPAGEHEPARPQAQPAPEAVQPAPAEAASAPDQPQPAQEQDEASATAANPAALPPEAAP